MNSLLPRAYFVGTDTVTPALLAAIEATLLDIETNQTDGSQVTQVSNFPATQAVTQSTSPWVTNDPGLPNALGQNTMANSTSVAIASDQSQVPIKDTTTGTWANGAQTAVGAAAVSVLAANANRKTALIQNVGTANVRVGIAGVTNTTGVRLVPGAILILEPPYVETNEIYAIREGGASSTVLAQETT